MTSTNASLADSIVAVLDLFIRVDPPELIQDHGHDFLVQASAIYDAIADALVQDHGAIRILRSFEQDPSYARRLSMSLQYLLNENHELLARLEAYIGLLKTSAKITSSDAGGAATDAGVAAGQLGVAVRGRVAGGIHIYAPPSARQGAESDDTESRNEHWQERATYLANAMRLYVSWLRALIDESGEEVPAEPYKSLAYFEVSDARIFFGREEAVEKMTRRIGMAGRNGKLNLLFAPSGAGKTSLLNAGVIPALVRGGSIPLYVVPRVGKMYDSPTAAIRWKITNYADKGHPSVDCSDLTLREFLGLVSAGLDGQTLVILIDQFEEFFIHLPEAVQDGFVNELAQCCDDATLPVKFVISIRQDYFGALGRFPETLPEIFHRFFMLLPLSLVDATKAIVEPAALQGVTFEPELVAQLVTDLSGAGMELPHLQIICSRLYGSRVGNVITIADYNRLGRAPRILGEHLSSVLDGLGRLKPIARDVLELCVTSSNTKRVLSHTELESVAEQDLLEKVLHPLVQARILRRDEDGDNVRFELTHEYLIREIEEWIDEDKRTWKRVQEMLDREMIAWREHRALMSSSRLDIIAAQKEHLRLDGAAKELLLRSALVSAHDLAYWPELSSIPDIRTRILGEYAGDTKPSVRSQVARTWSMLDLPESVPPLLRFALLDKDPLVREAAADGMLSLNSQRELALREVITSARNGNRSERRTALAVLARVRLSSLAPDLRWRVVTTRMRLRLSDIYANVLPPPVRKPLAIGFSAILLVAISALLVAINSDYLDTVEGAASQYSGNLVVRHGSPQLRFMPGFDHIVVETDVGWWNLQPEAQDRLAEGGLAIPAKKENNLGLDSLGQELLAIQTTENRAVYGWYVSEPPESAVAHLVASLKETTSNQALVLAVLEQVVTISDEPAIHRLAVEQLAPLLISADSNLQAAGVTGLSRLATPSLDPDFVVAIIDQLEPLLDSDNPNLRMRVLEALRHILVVADDPSTQQHVIDVFARYLGKQWRGYASGWSTKDWAHAMMGTPHSSVTEHAVNAILELDDQLSSSSYGSLLNVMLPAMADSLRYSYGPVDAPTISAQLIEKVFALIDTEEQYLFWSVMDFLQYISWSGSSSAESVVNILADFIETHPADQFWYTLGYWRVTEVFGYACNASAKPQTALVCYHTMKPFLHESAGLQDTALYFLPSFALASEDSKLVDETLEAFVALYQDEHVSDAKHRQILGSLGLLAATTEISSLRGSTLSLLRKAADSESPDIQVLGLVALIQAIYNESTSVELFSRIDSLLDDELPSKRQVAVSSAARILSQTSSQADAIQALDRLLILCKDREIEVRTAASEALRNSLSLVPSLLTTRTPDSDRSQIDEALYVYLLGRITGENSQLDVAIVDVLMNWTYSVQDSDQIRRLVGETMKAIEIASGEPRKSLLTVLTSLAQQSSDNETRMIVGRHLVELAKQETLIEAAKSNLSWLISYDDMNILAQELLLDDEVTPDLLNDNLYLASYMDPRELLIKIQDPTSKFNRRDAAQALALAALRDPDLLRSISGEVGTLRASPHAHVRVAANELREMLEIVTWVDATKQQRADPEQTFAYLRELLQRNARGNLDGQVPRPTILSHIRFIAEEALGRIPPSVPSGF